MKILFYNCFSGISGDMNLAAMIDLGVPLDYLLTELKKLNIEGYSVEVSNKLKMGISGTKVNVQLTGSHNHHHHHDHHADKSKHGHHHESQHANQHEHHHRTFTDIKKLINESSLTAEVKTTSIAIFQEVAVAEGKIHNKPAGEVHFHEVGAVDSIVDIVGAAICYHSLKPDKVVSTYPELGGGFVNCAHGHFPVPAPATLEILKDIPVTSGKVNTETTTPTGAAILKVLADEFVQGISGIPEKLAYGIGHKDMDIPNVLRVGWLSASSPIPVDTLCLLETNIDDITAEDLAVTQERIMEMGALDAWLSGIFMKKSRSAQKLSVLCEAQNKDIFLKFIFRETGSLGIRMSEVLRFALDRKEISFSSSIGTVRIKEAYLDGERVNFKPEADDVQKMAKKLKKPVREVRKLIEQEYTTANE